MMDWQDKVNLKTLEIAFDQNCNLACSYCSPTCSTMWQNDIRKNGAYQNLVSDNAQYQQNSTWDMSYGKHIFNAFFKSWESDLQYTLEELRVSGGEPPLAKDFWRLLDWWQSNKDCNVRLSVTSNLGLEPELIQKLVDATHSFKHFNLYTSNESFGAQAEYIRDGLVWDTWLGNIHKFLQEGNVRELHMLMTINALCLFSITDFMDEMIRLKETYGQFVPIMSLDILSMPSFQSPASLPTDIKEQLADNLENWLENVGKKHELFLDREHDGVNKLINYLREVQVEHQHTSSIETRERDFKSFYTQYDIRRNKSFENTFPENVVNWYKSIPSQVQKSVDVKSHDLETVRASMINNITRNYQPED